MDIFIYYRAPVGDAALLHRQVMQMQTALAGRFQVAVGLKRRPEPKDGMYTWMEIYTAIPSGFEAALAQAVTDAGLAGLISGARHTEYFQDVFSCA